MRWKQRREWAERVAQMHSLEAAPEPEQGHGPSWDAILAGRREFAGRVLGGPWLGHDVLILAYGKTRRRREPRPDDFGYSADYAINDWNTPGPGDDDDSFSVATIEELYERLDDTPIQWYPPAKSLAKAGLLFGGSGKEQNLENE